MTLDRKVVIDDSSWLICPSCGDTNLHHADVVVYSRAEDSKVTRETHVVDTTGLGFASYLVDSSASKNPSSRRHGMTIEFWCEHCEGVKFTLCISQHKGATEMYWKPKE
jgi:hypothetical protein